MLTKSSTVSIVTATIVALVFLGLGIFIGTKISKTAVPQGAVSGSANTYQAGWNAAKARLAQSPQFMGIPAGMEIKSVSGQIQKIDGNKLTVKINPLEPLADPNLDTRIITVDSNTKISLSVQKDPAQFQKEMQVFQDKMKQQLKPTTLGQQAPPAPLVPPMPFEKQDIKLSDLKANQQISVTANENIKDLKEFIAVQIDAQESATAPGAVSPLPTPTNQPATSSVQ